MFIKFLKGIKEIEINTDFVGTGYDLKKIIDIIKK